MWRATFGECRFVPASHLFEGLQRAWEILAESDPPFTWGANNRSLVSAERLTEQLSELDADEQVSHVIRRLATMQPGDYVDMEH